ncbi:unnamed protein product [Cylindrotheca closterium]|uniref:G-protein coupled receptors family 3 profile domain-containing protein n=1 Tax=Cylindrotheca closterium TaxID=2856 RepID=A0AAD2CRP9_9STRA|nr:unnamed protein product [Cylindrotheca closterium]
MTLSRPTCSYLLISFVAIAKCFSASDAQILNTFEEFHSLRNGATDITRVQSIDVVKAADESTTPICNLAMMMPFFDLRPGRIRLLENGVFQAMAAVMLAIEHLNTGNGTLVAEVEGLDQRCPIKFNLESFDSGLYEVETVNHVITLVSRQPGIERVPCAFLGAARSAVSIPSATISSLKGFPQISPISTSSKLDNPRSFPLFGRTIPSDSGTSVPAILYLRNKLGVKNLVIMYVTDAYGDAYAQGLRKAAEKYAPDMKIQTVEFPFEITPEIVTRTVKRVKETKYHYVFSIMFSTAHYDAFMTEAYDQGIAGDGDHFWMFSDSVSTSIFERTFEIGSPLHLASKGCSRISAVAGIEGDERYDAFIQSMADLNNPNDIALLQSVHPQPPEGFDPIQIADDTQTFFAKTNAAVVAFIYDATIALGLSACQAGGQNEAFFDGQQLYDEFLKCDFLGVTGNNTYDQVTGTRVTESARFSLLNVVEEEPEIEGENTVRLKAVVSDAFPNGSWEEVVPIRFNDGSTIPPPDLPPVEMDMNYIGWALRLTGWLSAVFIFISTIYLAMWTYKNRNKSVVLQTQPIFLYLICAGCFIMGIGIFGAGIDDEIASPAVCNVVCAMSPWFFCIGWVLAFSALYGKTACINRFFHYPVPELKIKIQKIDLFAPALGLMTIVTITLLAWTARAPPDFKRTIYEWNSFGQPTKSRGLCAYDGAVPYAIAIGFVFLISVEIAIRRAYEARKVAVEFAETEYIVLTLVTICGIAMFFILLWFLLDHDPAARFVVIAALIFLVSMSMLLLIFIPKIRFKTQVKRQTKENTAFGGSEGRINMQHGGANVAITGLDFSTNNGQSTIDDDPDAAEPTKRESAGMIVLAHPKEVDMLKGEFKSLKKEYDELRRNKSNRPATKSERSLDSNKSE